MASALILQLRTIDVCMQDVYGRLTAGEREREEYCEHYGMLLTLIHTLLLIDNDCAVCAECRCFVLSLSIWLCSMGDCQHFKLCIYHSKQVNDTVRMYHCHFMTIMFAWPCIMYTLVIVF